MALSWYVMFSTTEYFGIYVSLILVHSGYVPNDPPPPPSRSSDESLGRSRETRHDHLALRIPTK